ncbi:MAG: DUF2191 domain-containing protein [Acidimicrobiia bacterium]|nr:DUF2191 domain-containing protein [bacterium]MXX00416.1 DUF2191 domain-containing protein [Acidimicrobiia bacterium]MXX45948.1 DUF2191 domain-containing protein [Acidimicrobiia bacterium]MXY75406.1 DUF2191 domain-containing protein [Acidimicrobiia bacterium]MYA38610.1 DUF2191 domain-containing protein [Acidimicrobiia bacterium]
MRTTIELPDALLRRAKVTATREGVTLRSIIERGLRNGLARLNARSYRSPALSSGGQGISPGIDEGDWPTIRDIVYGAGADDRG